MKIPLKSFVTIHCPTEHKLSLVLDARDIYPERPGDGTPMLFVYGKETMTLECGSAGGNIGELGCSQAAIDWATSDELYDAANEWLNHFWALAEAKGES